MEKKTSIGSSLAALLGVACPVCIPAVGVFLASIGLGFLVSLKVILPVLVLLLLLTWWGMYEGYSKNHHQVAPLVISVIAGSLMPLGRYVIGSLAVVYIAVGVFICAAIWNYTLLKKCAK